MTKIDIDIKLSVWCCYLYIESGFVIIVPTLFWNIDILFKEVALLAGTQQEDEHKKQTDVCFHSFTVLIFRFRTSVLRSVIVFISIIVRTSFRSRVLISLFTISRLCFRLLTLRIVVRIRLLPLSSICWLCLWICLLLRSCCVILRLIVRIVRRFLLLFPFLS